ncbi:class I SAM-dependent methyltransferase [Buchnera aphidicola]|uniref:class I SAM-dependent methyltransferase n=1 Tax=Buchnera aphidicola TaxID=9 RepID=UPI003464A567
MNIYLMIQKKNKKTIDLINKYNLKHDENSAMALIINSTSLELYDRSTPIKKPIKVDFTSKKNNYRCLNLKKNELLYKAVGIKKNYLPSILDATAGLGTDSFLLSSFGCFVIMIEKHPVIAALLRDGLERGYKDKKIGNWLKKRLHLIFNDSLNMLKIPILQPDVIYLDPMYPIRKKKSSPKKEFQFLRKLINSDYQPEKLLNIAKKLAKKRIVVKRPSYASPLSKDKVDFVISNKSHRFDIYLPLKKNRST